MGFSSEGGPEAPDGKREGKREQVQPEGEKQEPEPERGVEFPLLDDSLRAPRAVFPVVIFVTPSAEVGGGGIREPGE